MDERISFEGVKKILHPYNVYGFSNQFFDGQNHFYGRIFWNSAAIFSYLPEKLYMNTGQIIATRLLQYVFILMSYFIIAFGLIRWWLLRILTLLVFFSIPFASYFFTMPKPEPLQLLFISTFIFYFVKKKAAFSNYWIFLGLAFGVKISTLPLIPFFFTISYFFNYKLITFKNIINSMMKISFPFLIGLSISVPILILPSALIILGINVFKHFYYKQSFRKIYLIILSMIYLLFLIIYNFEVVDIWISSTLLNTAHGSDDSHINFIHWFNYFTKEWLSGNIFMNYLLIISCILLIFKSIHTIKTNKYFKDINFLAICILFSGIILNLLVFLFVKRLWGHYLYIGILIFITGILILMDQYYFQISSKKIKKYEYLYIFSLVFYFFFHAINYWIPQTITDLNKSANRTKSIEYKKNLLSYNIMNNYLTKISQKRQHILNISIDPNVFQPTNSKFLNFKEYFGEIPWSDSNDIIILNTSNVNPKEYKKYVSSNTNLIVLNSPYFQKITKLPNASEILLKVNKIKI
jgi:hypothetical protein